MTSCSALSLDEVQRIRAYYRNPTFKLFSMAVAKLYLSRGDCPQWTETGLVGVWTFFAHEPSKTLYLQLLDLQTGTRFFTQELYEGFEYLQATPYFHTFESDDCIMGVSFAQEEDALRTYGCVCEVLGKKEYRLKPSTLKKAWQKFSSFTSKRAAAKKEEKEEKALVISSPSNFKHESHMGFSEGKFGFWGRDPQTWLSSNPAWKLYYQQALGLSEEEVDSNAAQLMSITASHLKAKISCPRAAPPVPVPPRPSNLRAQLTRSQELREKLRLSAELVHQQSDGPMDTFAPPAPPSGDAEEPTTAIGQLEAAPNPPAPPPAPQHFQLIPAPRPPKLPSKPDDMPEEEQRDLRLALISAFDKIRPAHDPSPEDEEGEEEEDPFGDDEPYYLN